LTQKVKRTDSDEEDEENVEDIQGKEYKEAEDQEEELVNDIDNVKTETEVEEFIKFCREYYDKKQQTKGKKIETSDTPNEIILEKEKEISCHDKKNSISQSNTSDMKNKLDNNEKNNILQANTNNTKSKLRGNKKSSTLEENRSDVKSKCDNEKSDISHANTKESCSNEESSTSLVNTNDMKARIHKEKKNKKKSSTCDYATKSVDICELSKPCSDSKSNKKSKSQDKNKISNSKEPKKENSKRKLNMKRQEMKKKLKTNKAEKYEKEEKENEDYSPSLEFENPKRKPILDSPLEETTSRKNVHKDSDRTSLKTIANTVQEPADVNHEVDIDLKRYANIEYLETQLPDVVTGGDEDSEQEEENNERDKIMSEIFADDDAAFAEEFRKEKEEEVRNKRISNKNYICI